MKGPMRVRNSFRLLLITLLGVVWAAPTSRAAAIIKDIDLGDSVIARIAAAGTDTVCTRFYAVQGTLASIRARASLDSTLALTVALKDESGTAIDLGDSLRLRGKTAHVRRFEIQASGTYCFEIGATLGSGGFKAKTAGRFPRKHDLAGNFPADAVHTFDVMPWSTLKAQVKADRGSNYQPTVESVADQGGDLTLEGLTAKDSRAKFKLAVAPAGGTVTCTLGGTDTGGFAGRVRVKTPRSRNKFDLTAPGAVTTLVTTLSGTVSNSLTGTGLEGTVISLDPAVPGLSIVTGADGTYLEEVPAGNYDVTFQATGFVDQIQATSVLVGSGATADAALVPVAPVVPVAKASGTEVPGGGMTATAPTVIFDGSTLLGTSWTQTRGPDIGPLVGDSPTFNLPDASAFKETLLEILAEPAIDEGDLPPNLHLPEEGICEGGTNNGDACANDAECSGGVCNTFFGGLQDRFQVVGVNPLALEEAMVVTLEAEVTTDSGDYTDEVEIHVTLPFKWSAGIQDVPLGIPVILHGKTQASYDWALSPPGGSGATLVDPTMQSPDFTPDGPGVYAVTATDLEAFCDVDECDGGPNHAGVCSSDNDCNQVLLSINAGTWEGVISGQDAEGRPLAASCTGCHSGWAPDMFTPWAQSGHAEIFTNNLDTSTHYGPNCFSCHAVGFDTGVANGGFDDAPDYADFLGSGLLNNPGDNWTTMLATYPEAAKLANIQCENCHGPQNTDLHSNGTLDPERISISSDVCAVCHGEPLRHARFQQWQLSGHANYELAVDEGDSGSCSRCHTGNGFLAWLPVLLGDEPGDPTDDLPEPVAWTPDETHPQTCVTCHDPHNPGTTTGVGTDSKVRIYGNTPPLVAGFTAYGVGNGAICMTCHNSRRGARNDSTFAATKADGDEARAPHGSAQADMLMGQNAYLVTVGTRGSHSLVEDTCVNCHMEQTPPPDLLSYNLGGTNHTFSASEDICGSCHGFDDAVGVQSAFQGSLDALQTLVEEAILQLITDLIGAGNTIDLDGSAIIDDPADVLAIEFGEARGRQAITVTLVGVPDPIGPLRMTNVDVIGPDAGELYDTADDRLPKAGWNWNLTHNDGSKGVHNPDFTFQVLDAGIDALVLLAAESAP